MSSTFEVDGIANSTLTEAVDEIITNFKSLKPPFICPIDRCAKPCLGLMSLKHHLLKLHKERLSQIRHSEDENTLSDGNDGFENVQTPNAAANSFSATNSLANRSRKGGRRKRRSLKFTSQKNRAALRASKAGTLGATDDEFGNPEGDELQYATTSQNTSLSPTSGGQLNMTYEESLRVAMFHVQGRSYRVEIDEPLPLKFVDIPSGKSRDSSSLQASATLGSAGSSTSLTGKGSGSVKSKNRITKGASAAKPPLKKLPEAEVKWFENPPIIGKPHVVPKLYREFKEKTAEELDRDVEYVMDDLDYAWLKMYNLEHRVQKCLPEVSTKDFELLMDRLEKDSRFETNIKGQGGGNLGSVGGGDDHEEDAVCSICQDGEANNTNVILFCDMCNLPVHQECYGVPYIPEGQWVCRKCLLSPSHPVSCPLCPIKTGAFKQTSKNKWCHVSCAIWIPEVQFANAVFLEPIENLENIPAARFKLCCYICKKRNVGACVQCSKANCFTAFHIACGQSAGLHIKLEPIKHPEHSPTLVNVKKVAYCDVHTPADSDRKPLINSSGSSSSAEDSKNSKKLKQIFAQNKSQTASQVQVCLPEISPEKYEEIVGRVNFPAKVQFLTRLTSYWLLRRQALNGFPLIKRLHMTHIQKQQHNAQVALEKCENDNEEIAEIKATLANLRDIRKVYEKARLLGEQVKKREKMKREWHQLCEREFTLCATSLHIILTQLIQQLKDLDTQKFFTQPVDTNMVADYRIVVDEPMDLGTMEEKVDNMSYSTMGEFSRDFSLVIYNCMRYNNRETPYFKAALKIRDSGCKLIRQAYRFVNKIGIDPSTGLLTSKPPPVNHYNCVNLERALAYEPPPERYWDHIDYLCHFLDCAASGESRLSEDHVQLLRQVVDELNKGMLEWMDVDVQKRLKRHAATAQKKPQGKKHPPPQQQQQTSASSAGKTGSKRRKVDSVTISESEEPTGCSIPSPSTHSRVSRRSTSMGEATLTPPLTMAYIHKPTRISLASASTTNKVASRSPSMSQESLDGKQDSKRGSSRKNSSIQGQPVSQVPVDRVNPAETTDASLEDSEDDDCLFQHMDFVWAKCRGFPSYPAIVIAPETLEGTKYNGIPIPVPPAKVLEQYEYQLKSLVPNSVGSPVVQSSTKTDAQSTASNVPKLILVAFYETPTTWQWVVENQLEPLFTDQTLDEAKLEEPRKSVDKLKVRVAYTKARRAYEMFSGQRDPVDEFV